MDPFSIAASAVALTETATKLTSSLVTLVRAHLTAESRITALCNELTQLTGFLQSVDKTLKGCRKYDFVMIDEQFWERSDAAMEDCKTTLAELEAVVTKIQGHVQPRGFAWRTRAVVDLSVYAAEIAASRDKIHQSNWSLQTILHTVTISLQVRSMAWNSTAHDTVLVELKQLRTAIDETFHASSRPAGGFSNNQTGSTMTRNMQGLAEAASHFYSSASSTASSTRSMRSNTSIDGDFPDSRRERVEDFVDQLQGPSRWSTSSPAPTAKSLAPPRPIHSVPTPAKVDPDEEDVDSELELLFLNGLRELASASMKNQDYAKAIEHIKEALKQPNPCKEESDQLRIQLACCYIFQGAWKRAAPIITKLAESQQDLVVCSLLHALALGYLLDYHFDDAMAACKKALQGRKRLRCHHPADWIEYNEALGLYATIFHMQGDYIREEVLRRQLPAHFTYVHPGSEVQYLQSKSDLLQSVIGDDTPRLNDVVELDAGPVDLQDLMFSRITAFGNSNSLREKVMQHNRYEEDTMKEVVFVEPDLPPSPMDDKDNVETLPVSPTKESLLRRRLTRLLGSRSRREPTSPVLETVHDEDADLADTESAGLPSPGPSLRRRNTTWLIQKSKTLLKKRTWSIDQKKGTRPTQKSDAGAEASFPGLSKKYRPPSVFSFDASEEETITTSSELHRTPPVPLLKRQAAIRRPAFSRYDPAGSREDARDQTRSTEALDEGYTSEEGPSAIFGANDPSSLEAQDGPLASRVIRNVLTASASVTAPEDVCSALVKTATILASVQTIRSADDLQAHRLDLEVLLERLRSMSLDLHLIEDVKRAIEGLACAETAAFEAMEDSGYESLEDRSKLTGPIPRRHQKPRRQYAKDSPYLRRSFSWKAGSDTAYTSDANQDFRPAHDADTLTSHDDDHALGTDCSEGSSSGVYRSDSVELAGYESRLNEAGSRTVGSRHSEAHERVAHPKIQSGWDWHYDYMDV